MHDLIKRCQKALEGYEEKLHLVEKFLSIKEKVHEIDSVLDAYESGAGKSETARDDREDPEDIGYNYRGVIAWHLTV